MAQEYTEPPEIPEYTDEDLLEYKTFRSFLKHTDGWNTDEIQKTIRRFCSVRLMNELDKNISKNSSKENTGGRESLKRWLETDEDFKIDILYARRQLGIEDVEHMQCSYKDFDEALEDLVWQMWVADGSKGNFEEDVLEKGKSSEGYLEGKPNMWKRYTICIAGAVEEILSGDRLNSGKIAFIEEITKGEETKKVDLIGPALNGGWTQYIIAKIASPDMPQPNISFFRESEEDYPVSIIGANSEEVIVSIKGGATKGEIAAIWNACRPLLVQPVNADTKIDAILCSRPLSVDKDAPYHTSVYDIAEKYYVLEKKGDIKNENTAQSDHIHKLYRYRENGKKS